MRWGTVDIKQFEKFEEQVQKLQQTDFDRFCRDVSRDLAARLLRMAKQRTPVGKKPKFGKKTTKVQGVGSRTVKRKLNNGGSVTYKTKTKKNYTLLTKEGERHQKYWTGYTGGNLRRNWNCDGNVVFRNGEYRIWVYNPVEYAIYVEYGHRQEVGRYVPHIGKRLKQPWVEGRFMLTKSEILLQDKVDKIIESRLRKVLKDALNGK